MPPILFKYVFKVSGAIAMLFMLVGAVLTGIFQIESENWGGAYGLYFFCALAFCYTMRLTKDAWNFWPYAYHSLKFAIPSFYYPHLLDGKERKWVAYSPLLISCLVGLLAAALMFLYLYLSGGAGNVSGFSFWLAGVLIVPALIFLAGIMSGGTYMKAYLNTGKEMARKLSFRGYLIEYFIIPETIIFFIINSAILLPLGAQARFAVQPGVFSLDMIMVLAPAVLLSTGAIMLNAGTDVRSLLTGAIFSNVIEITDLKTIKEEPAKPARLKFFLGVASVLLLIAVGLQFSGLAWQFEHFLILAELIWAGVFVYLRYRILESELSKVYGFFKNNPEYYSPGQLARKVSLPLELSV